MIAALSPFVHALAAGSWWCWRHQPSVVAVWRYAAEVKPALTPCLANLVRVGKARFGR
jgi:hypothetical protein